MNRCCDHATPSLGVIDSLRRLCKATVSVANPRPSAPPVVAGRFKVTSFNVENYFNGDLNATQNHRRYAPVRLDAARLGGDEISVGLIYNTRTVKPLGAAATLLDGPFAQGRRPPLIQAWKESLLLREPLAPPQDRDGDGRAELGWRRTGAIHPLVRNARAAGLQVHAYTLRTEEPFLALPASGEPAMEHEIADLLGIGCNGWFTDFPDRGVVVRDRRALRGS